MQPVSEYLYHRTRSATGCPARIPRIDKNKRVAVSRTIGKCVSRDRKVYIVNNRARTLNSAVQRTGLAMYSIELARKCATPDHIYSLHALESLIRRECYKRFDVLSMKADDYRLNKSSSLLAEAKITGARPMYGQMRNVKYRHRSFALGVR